MPVALYLDTLCNISMSLARTCSATCSIGKLSACAHLFQCCVIQEIAGHLMTEPLSAVESALQVHLALLQNPRKNELDRNV